MLPICSKVYCTFSEHFRIDPRKGVNCVRRDFCNYYFEIYLENPFLLELIRPATWYAKGSCPVGQVLNRSPVQVVAAFADLGTTTAVTDDTESAIEAFLYAFLYANCMNLILLWLMLLS